MISNKAQEPPDEPSGDERMQLEYEQLRLENEKLRLEISEFKRPWYLKPNHSLYVLIAVCTLSVGIVTDRYQAFSSKLDSERALLEQRKNDFAMQRDAVQKELDQTKTQLNDKAQQLASASQQLTSTKQELVAANQQLEINKLQDSLQSTKNGLPLLALKNAHLIQDFNSISDKKPKLFPRNAVSETQLLQLSPALQRFLKDQKAGNSLSSKPLLLSQWKRKPPSKESWSQYVKRKVWG